MSLSSFSSEALCTPNHHHQTKEQKSNSKQKPDLRNSFFALVAPDFGGDAVNVLCRQVEADDERVLHDLVGCQTLGGNLAQQLGDEVFGLVGDLVPVGRRKVKLGLFDQLVEIGVGLGKKRRKPAKPKREEQRENKVNLGRGKSEMGRGQKRRSICTRHKG